MTAIMEYPKTDKHAAFQVQLRVNFADGSGGGQRTRIVGTEGVINLGWNDFVLKKHLLPEAPGSGGWDLYGTFHEDVKKPFVARDDKEYPRSEASRVGTWCAMKVRSWMSALL